LAQSEKLRNFSEAMAKDNYQKIISVLESFFKGNTKPIETLLNQEIQEAIKLQHFEWAGKLRDIYLHVGEFTEKQTVVLSKPLTGHIFMIKEIGEWFVYVLIYFYEGKLVDIISQKVSKIEYDEHSLIVSMEAEFGDFVQK
jgi:excinuclease UvrABC nuclease subunit